MFGINPIVGKFVKYVNQFRHYPWFTQIFTQTVIFKQKRTHGKTRKSLYLTWYATRESNPEPTD